ncbi:hypothetical protein DFH09DRAFT_1171899 [Mycena vulgaris]|nr:hypothetical protein DFH09DRAFT_1171899 [Mycena vulgaris]
MGWLALKSPRPPCSPPIVSMSNRVPLTTHNLPSQDRARLIRSIRKIEEVVGETPYFVDVSSFPPPQEHASSKKRLKRLRVKHAPGTSAPPSPVAPDARPVLYIRVPDSPPPEHGPVTPAPSPTLTVALNLRYATVNDDTARRRKMAKLSRTLGPNVPQELVFPPPSTDDVRRLRRLTARTVNSDRMSRVESLASSKTSRRRSGASGTARRHSKADSISHGWVWVGRREDIPSDILARVQPDSGLPSDWASAPIPTFRAMYRKEEGWSGEWAGTVRNMDDVVHQLRGLRVK